MSERRRLNYYTMIPLLWIFLLDQGWLENIYINILISIIIAGVLFDFKRVMKDCTDTDDEYIEITCAKPLEFQVLPSYLGFFFLLLSIPKCNFLIEPITSVFSLFLFLGILFFWNRMQEYQQFNIFLVFMGYRYYEMTDVNNVIITLIIKEKAIKVINGQTKRIEGVKKLNEYTYIKGEDL